MMVRRRELDESDSVYELTPAEQIPERGEMVCTHCGSLGKPITWNAGHALGIFLFSLFGLLPGIAYALALNFRFPQCRACGARRAMIPPDSPKARRILEDG
jgi:hypothetical protein